MIPRRFCEISDKNRIFILFILHPVGAVLLKRCLHCPLGSILLHKHHLHFEPSAAFTRVRPLFSSYKQIFFLAAVAPRSLRRDQLVFSGLYKAFGDNFGCDSALYK